MGKKGFVQEPPKPEPPILERLRTLERKCKSLECRMTINEDGLEHVARKVYGGLD